MDECITKVEALKKLGLKSQIGLYRLRKAGTIFANRVNAKAIYYSTNSIRAYKLGKSA
ncbi:hypothetical protein [uncultured Campylobacter sp.]|uniref:hypothetical protein n=1 Tax=uncultured Campylobacter sp. TaxID=218934 RepID=UPI0026337DE5|nr:hypothetical protein [uncultured Campylobacter sp.]